jgi:hypothetical protein
MVNPTEDIFSLDATHVAFIDADQNHRFNADGGSTWATVGNAPTAGVTTTATSAPDRGTRPQRRIRCRVLTPDGTMAWLSTSPALITGFQRATDGSLGFAGADGF